MVIAQISNKLTSHPCRPVMTFDRPFPLLVLVECGGGPCIFYFFYFFYFFCVFLLGGLAPGYKARACRASYSKKERSGCVLLFYIEQVSVWW